MTQIEKAVAQLGGPSAVGRLFDVVYQTPQQWIAQGRVPAEYCPRIEQLTGIRCEELNDRVDWSLIRGTAPVGGVAKSARAEGAPPPAGLICELTAQGAVFARKLADLQQRGYHVLGHILHKDGEYALMHGSCRWLTQPQYQRLMHEQDGSLFVASAPVDHAAELRRATSAVPSFDASDVGISWTISPDDAARFAAAEIARAARVAGDANASIAKEIYTGAGAAPVVVENSAADQAADAMAAESAQLTIQAERAAAGAAARAAVEPLAVLSREVFSLSDKLQQPADLVVQLLVLAELRGLRGDDEKKSPVGQRIGVCELRDAISRASAELRR